MTIVDLTPQSEKLLRERLQSGRYASASEIVEEALGLLAQRDANGADDLLGLDVDFVRAMVQEAVDDPEPPTPAGEVFRRIEEKHLRSRAGSR